MDYREFKLERYFALYEFKTKYIACASDGEAMTLKDILSMADNDSLTLWDNMKFNYTESEGDPLLRDAVSEMYNNYYSNEINNGNHDLVIESQYRYEQSFDWLNPQANYNSDTDDDDDVIDINNLNEIVKVNHNEIQFESEIGRSATGKVYKSRWKDNDVVTKRFHTNDINNEQALNYMNELNKKNEFFKHDNILKIYGYCLKPFLLIIENMDAGTLKNYTKNDTSIPMIEKVELLLQAALGLQHLHSKGIIHQNIAARNLLMSTIDDKKSNNNNSNNNNNIDTIGDDDTEIIVKAPPKQRYRVAVSDYGMTRILNEEVYAQTYASIGPLKWMAPESISDFTFSFKSDVYSFGITMWEVLTGRDPYPDIDPVNTAVEVLVKQRRPPISDFIPPRIKKLMRKSWHKDPNSRPTFERIVQELRKYISESNSKTHKQ
mmetsp:Transcript_48744/g.59953  ORF Transcript_48744/g.59953 Transcript_48744/m.59953 type:complete len:434 (+) Transcript_48744:33-1334(+)